jgi:hypothetical protein
MGFVNPELQTPEPNALPSFGQETPSIGKRLIPLDSARDNEVIELGASNFIWAVEATGSNANVEIRFNAPHNSGITVKEGMMLKVGNFKKIYITNSAQSGKNITLHYGLMSKDFNILNAASSTQEVNVAANTGLSTTADGSALATATTSILAANTNRKEAIIKNLDASTSLRIGDSNAGASRGHELKAGESIILSTTAQIYAYNASGTAVAVSLVEVEE